MLSPITIMKVMAPQVKNNPLQVLIVTYDAGETNFLIPAVRELATHDNVEIQIVALGTSASVWNSKLSESEKKLLIDINTTCGVKTHITQNGWVRENLLPAEDIASLQACLDADVVVSGAMSKAQDQIGEAMIAEGARHLVVHDGFGPFNDESVEHLFLDSATEFLVPSRYVKESLKKIDPKAKVEIVGQPSLNDWIQASDRLNATEIRGKLGLSGEKPILVYAGGYGPAYEQAFELFCQAAKDLKDDYDIVVSIHPKRDDSVAADDVKNFERNTLDKYGLRDIKVISVKRTGVSTMEAAFVSDIVASHDSTVGIQALFMGKPTLYLDVPTTTYTNFALEEGYTFRATNPSDFSALVRRLDVDKVDNNPKQRSRIFKKMGVPANAAKLVVDEILN